MDIINLTDRELVRWATKYGGWKYFNSNDQLRDPEGFFTTANNWERISVREQIIKQMETQATEAQIKDIKI